MAHYDCSCCGEAMGISHDHCPECKAGNCHRPAPVSEVRGFHVSGNGAKDLVETCINDLRMHGNGRNVHCIDAEAGGVSQTRREAVIILYASGAIGVFEGWNVKHDDVPELLAAKVLRDG